MHKDGGADSGLDSYSSWRAHSEIITAYSERSSGLLLCKMSVEVLFEKLTQNLQQKHQLKLCLGYRLLGKPYDLNGYGNTFK